MLSDWEPRTMTGSSARPLFARWPSSLIPKGEEITRPGSLQSGQYILT